MPTLFTQPVFQLYVLCSGALVAILYGLGFYTAKLRNDRKQIINHEDIKVNSGAVQVDVEHPDVQRVKRAHANALENSVPFFVLGLLVSPICLFFIAKVKNALGYDDSLDVFGVHCVGGIFGALATGVLAAPSLGGQGAADYTKFPYVAGTDPSVSYDMAHQMIVQLTGVSITLVWSGLVSAVLFFAIDKAFGLRPSHDVEREGLDLNEHGERAYNY